MNIIYLNCEKYIFILSSLPLTGLQRTYQMTTSQLAFWLSWLERCTSITEVTGSNPVQA